MSISVSNHQSNHQSSIIKSNHQHQIKSISTQGHKEHKEHESILALLSILYRSKNKYISKIVSKIKNNQKWIIYLL